ncbi:DNA double-strand break repair nuclease NurA [Candidatus Dependentiae bacterium]|nr:DNA double-strand break repair nuclease NurA [Candidatus Dependentiae bacterium]
MLDRIKTAQLVTAAQGRIFRQARSLRWLTKEVWQHIVTQPAFVDALGLARAHQSLTTWQGSLADTVASEPFTDAYDVIAIDGSQIYPDNHFQGIDCFLINTGLCHLSYAEQSSVRFAVEPYLFTPQEALLAYKQSFFSPDLVDLIREDYELKLLAEQAKILSDTSQKPVGLFDGNVFFWHLEVKPQQIKTVFLEQYFKSLTLLYEQGFLYAGYLSGARFSDLASLLRVGLCEGSDACQLSRSQLYDICTMAEVLTDAELLAFVLAPGERTTLFSCVGAIADAYPEHSKPWFFYLHTGEEVVRIEVPAWIAAQSEAIAHIVSCCLDQAIKGRGYPVALAEAHAQAVVTGADRAFFYEWISMQSVRQQRNVAISPKGLKKKLLGV